MTRDIEQPISRYEWEDLKDQSDNEDGELDEDQIDAVQYGTYAEYKEAWHEGYCDSKASLDYEERAYGRHDYDYESDSASFKDDKWE